MSISTLGLGRDGETNEVNGSWQADLRKPLFVDLSRNLAKAISNALVILLDFAQAFPHRPFFPFLCFCNCLAAVTNSAKVAGNESFDVSYAAGASHACFQLLVSAELHLAQHVADVTAICPLARL